MGHSEADVMALVKGAESSGALSKTAATNIGRWLTEEPFAQYRDRLVEDIVAARWETLDNAFYEVLEFGTGGRRGRMYPVGTNVLNDRTMAESARGLVDYVIESKGANGDRSCAIAFDTRHNSRDFAHLCARVIAAAGFKVYLFPEPRSTPLLSTAVRYLKCDAGIMITASHNAPSDNGFKCYNAQGGQVIPPDDEGIIACVRKASDREIPEIDFEQARSDGSIVILGTEVDEHYLNSVVAEEVTRARDLTIIYTPLHGVGESSVAAALRRAGFERVTVLASQRTPDGDFPNVPDHVSNPENPATLEAAIEEARAKGADLVIASDPDADRIGVAVPVTGDPRGEWTTLTGNQIGALLTAFVIKQTEAMGKLRNDHYVVTTLVSSRMARALTEREGVRIEDDLLVGFKWIAERIDDAGHAGFLFGFEESHGYLKGDYARDKDAAIGALLFAELAATVKDRRQTILEYLDDLYIDVGHYGEGLINLPVGEGPDGKEKVRVVMEAFRETPPMHIGGLDVVDVHDYKTHEVRSIASGGPTRLLDVPITGNLLLFHLSNSGTRFAVRPSGTEPKIKFYLFAHTDTAGVSDRSTLANIKEQTRNQLELIRSDIEKYVRAVLVEAAS